MPTNGVENLIDGEWFVINLHGTLYDSLGQTHVHHAVVNHRIGQQRVDNSLQIAHASIGRLCDVLHYVVGNLKTVALNLAVQDVDTKLQVGFLQLCNQSACEPCQQPFVHSFQVYWWPITGQDDALAIAEQVVEDMKEGVLCLRCRHPLLYIVDNQQINSLIKVDEIVHRVLQNGIGVLHLKQACTDVQHPFLRV